MRARPGDVDDVAVLGFVEREEPAYRLALAGHAMVRPPWALQPVRAGDVGILRAGTVGGQRDSLHVSVCWLDHGHGTVLGYGQAQCAILIHHRPRHFVLQHDPGHSAIGCR